MTLVLAEEIRVELKNKKQKTKSKRNAIVYGFNGINFKIYHQKFDKNVLRTLNTHEKTLKAVEIT